MKKTLFVSAALFALVISASAFSPKNKKTVRVTTPKIEQSFIEEFGNQENVEWNRQGTDLVYASFSVGTQSANAYFDNDGNYVCATTEIQTENLPLKLMVAANKAFADASINAILQMTNPDETAYFFQVTDSKGTKVWKGYTNGTIELFKKISKAAK